MYICMLEFLKENFGQEVFGTSMPYKKYVCDFWYFTHHDMMNEENIGCKVIYEVNFLCEKYDKMIVVMCIGNALISKCFEICEEKYDYAHVIC